MEPRAWRKMGLSKEDLSELQLEQKWQCSHVALRLFDYIYGEIEPSEASLDGGGTC